MTSFRENALGAPALGVGIGLRSPHVDEIRNRPTSIAWFEFTPENYMNRGGSHLKGLLEVAERYPMAAHGIGASLGTHGCPSREYLASLKKVIELTGARWASDHLCYTTAGGFAVNELLPLPFTTEAVQCVVANIKRIQDAIGVPWLVENISYYATIDDSEMDEAAFITAVLEESGCGLLLDVNNVFVNAHNHGYDPAHFIARLPLDRVVQVHLAGHDQKRAVYIDTHGEAVQDGVWKLFEETWPLLPACSVLVEWDHGVPSLERLEAEALRARVICETPPETTLAGATGDAGAERRVPASRRSASRESRPSAGSSLQVGFRELVRDPTSPASLSHRERLLAKVDDLAADDRAALMRISPERLAIYHDLVVGSHRALSDHIYGFTFALLDVIGRERPDLAGGTSSRALVEAFLAEDMATTHSVRELADRLDAFLRRRYPAAFREIGLLSDLTEFERLKLVVDHAEDGPGSPASAARLEEMSRLTVGDLFDMLVLVPSFLRTLKVAHDVRAAIAALADPDAGVTLGHIVAPLETTVVMTRHPASLLPVFHTVATDVVEDLHQFAAGGPFTLEQFASARQARGPKDESEEQALERVLSEAFGWLAAGMLLLAPA